MTEPQHIGDFDEALTMLLGLVGRIVEASLFLPWDEGGHWMMNFSGTLEKIELPDDERCRLKWQRDDNLPTEPSVTIWRRRFVEAELDFTGSAEDSFEEIDPTQGHNTFLKIRCEGFVVDLISYD